MTSSSPLPLDDDGLLPEAAFKEASHSPAYLVFAQQRDARIDVAAWERHARQFFATELRLTRPKHYGAVPPRTDGAHLVATRAKQPPVMRTVLLRPRTDDDLALAESAEAGGGLVLLAKRCSVVVLVLARLEGSPDDQGALLLAALIASVALGPILSPDRRHLFGARTARGKLDAPAS